VVSENVERLYGLGQDVLSGRALGVLNRPDGGLVVGENGAFARAVRSSVYVEYHLQRQGESAELDWVHGGGGGCPFMVILAGCSGDLIVRVPIYSIEPA
jgi:hypothetical protein